MAGEFIVQLQTIVSRQENPRDPAVVTIGDIHGGTRRNIIPNEVKLELTTRAFSERARDIIVDGIRRTAQALRCPQASLTTWRRSSLSWTQNRHR